jgi:ABC-type phosphate/phosphonate transport system permease subunit
MFENFFQLVKIGKELGLNKREISKVLLFNNTKNPTLYTILMIIGIILSGIVIIFIVIVIARNLYPAGALYSTVKTKDFKKKKDN